MRTLGYTRISKDDENSVSLDYQRAEIERYCEREGLSLVGIEVDNGISGKTIKNRPAVQRVLQCVDLKTIDAVVVFKSDRMSRNGLESLQIETLMKQRGVAYYSVTEGHLAHDSVDDEFLSFIRAGLNQRERKLIAMRTRQALQRKKEKGERISGRPPFGYAFEEGRVIQNPSEQSAIRMIRNLSEAGMPLRRIPSALASEGVLNREGKPFGYAAIYKIAKAS